MNIADVILHPTLLLALIIYGVAALALVWLEYRYETILHHNPLTAWISAHALAPAARALLLLVFITMTYPILYGVEGAPPLAEVLAGGPHRINHLLNIAVIVSILLPLLPGLGAIPGLVLPVQGIAAAALLFHWLSTALGIDTRLAPSGLVATLIVIWAYVGHKLAWGCAHALAEWTHSRWEQADVEKAAYELLILILQIPALLIYTLHLGAPLRAAG